MFIKIQTLERFFGGRDMTESTLDPDVIYRELGGRRLTFSERPYLELDDGLYTGPKSHQPVCVRMKSITDSLQLSEKLNLLHFITPGVPGLTLREWIARADAEALDDEFARIVSVELHKIHIIVTIPNVADLKSDARFVASGHTTKEGLASQTTRLNVTEQNYRFTSVTSAGTRVPLSVICSATEIDELYRMASRSGVKFREFT